MGTPNIRPKRNGYEARIVLHGKRWSAYGASESEAAQNLEEKLLQWQRPLAGTFGSWIETAYLPSLEHRPDSARQVRSLKAHFAPIARLPLAEVDRAALQALINAKARSGLSWWTVHHLRKIAHAALNLAEADGLIPSNPARFVKLPSKPAAVQATLDAEELGRLIYAAQGTRSNQALAAAVLGGLLGLGYKEMRSLEPKHFAARGNLAVPGTKTKHRNRILPLPEMAFDLLAPLPFPLIGASNESTNKALATAAKRAGVLKPNRQILRHSCATGLQGLGCPPEIRSAILGHSTGGMAAHYAHADLRRFMSDWLSKWVDACLDRRGEHRGEQSPETTAV